MVLECQQGELCAVVLAFVCEGSGQLARRGRQLAGLLVRQRHVAEHGGAPEEHDAFGDPEPLEVAPQMLADATDVPALPDTPEGRLAGRVRQYRAERRWSQAELASRMSDLGHGWHQTTVAKTERAERDPRYPELVALAEALAVPLEALLGIASEPTSEAATEARLTVHRLEQEEQLLLQRVAFLGHDIDDLETQRKEHLQRLSELKNEIATARKAYKAART